MQYQWLTSTEIITRCVAVNDYEMMIAVNETIPTGAALTQGAYEQQIEE